MTLVIILSSMMQEFVNVTVKDWKRVNLHNLVGRGMVCLSAASGDDEFIRIANSLDITKLKLTRNI